MYRYTSVMTKIKIINIFPIGLPQSLTGRSLRLLSRSILVITLAVYVANMAAILVTSAGLDRHGCRPSSTAVVSLRRLVGAQVGETGSGTGAARHRGYLGTVGGSEVLDALERSSNDIHRHAWLAMASADDGAWSANTLADGLRRVVDGVWGAFLWHRPGLVVGSRTTPVVTLGEFENDEESLAINYGLVVGGGLRRRGGDEALSGALIQLLQTNYFQNLDDKYVKYQSSIVSIFNDKIIPKI